MVSLRWLTSLVLPIAIFMVCNPSGAAQEDTSAVLAEVGSHKITAAELQQKKANELLQERYKYYLAEREALDHLIDEELLDMQASREGISRDELFKKYVASQVSEPTEDQLRFYYEGLTTDESYDAVRQKIIDTVRKLRLNKARAAYLATLRNQYGVVVELSQPSSQVDIAGAPRRGLENAPVQVVEFADYECPYCQKVDPELKRLHEHFGDKVAVVYKDFPLPIHPLAQKASEAARCAGAQGKFWEFHDALFDTRKFEVSDLKQEARNLQLDGTRFDHCLDSGEQAATVEKDRSEGQRLGLTGTPSFFVNGRFLSGAVSYAKLRGTVEEELAAKSSGRQSASMTPLKDSGSK